MKPRLGVVVALILCVACSIWPKPTLSPLDINGLASETDDCNLPCWWGILPGETEWQTAEKLFERLGAGQASGFDSQSIVHNITLTDTRELNTLIFGEIEESSDKVVSLSLRLSTKETINRLDFQKTWNQLAPENVLAKYGQPSGIYLSAFSSRPSQALVIPYEFWLSYDEQGFLLRYDGFTDLKEILIFCPFFGSEGNLGGGDNSVALFVSSDLNEKTLGEMAGLAVRIPESVLNLEEATGITVISYYEAFLDSGHIPCLETNSSVWP